MNFSNAFRRGVENFMSFDGITEYTPDYYIPGFDRNQVFTYMIPRGGLTPIHRISGINQFVAPIYWQCSAPLVGNTQVTKAEDVFRRCESNTVTTYILNKEPFYIICGFLFDKDKNPLIITCRNPSNNIVVCFDYSVLENPDLPMNRFLLRKFIPYLIEARRHGSPHPYMFVNCKEFVVKPTFQGELDESLVRDFLVERVNIEYKLRNATSSSNPR